MAGQGRPLPKNEHAKRVGRLRLALLGSVAFFVWICGGSLAADPSPAGDEAEGVDLAFRVRLICDAPLEIDGEFSASQGNFETPENLSMDAGTTGGFWLRPDRQSIRVQPRGASDRLGFQARYVGDASDVLRLRLRIRDSAASQAPGAAGEQSVNVALPVEDLIDGSYDQMIAGGVRLWVTRAPGDELHVRLGSSGGLVFSASEEVPLGVAVNAVSVPDSRPLELQMKLHRDGDKARPPLWQRTVAIAAEDAQALAAGPVAVEVHAGSLELPAREGVYTLHARLVPSTGGSLVDRLSRPELFSAGAFAANPFGSSSFAGGPFATESIAERSVQFVVLEPLPPPVDPTPLAEIARLRPLDRSWLGVGATNAESGKPLATETYGGREVAALAPGDWMAQPIPVNELGKPHVIVVRYPADQPVKLGISIREPNAAGKSSPLGIDSGVVHEPDVAAFDFTAFDFSRESPASNSAPSLPAATAPATELASGTPLTRVSSSAAPLPGGTLGVAAGSAGDQALWGEHRVVFWPRYRQPVVIISNPDPQRSVRIESIAVEAGPERLAGGGLAGGGLAGGGLAAGQLTAGMSPPQPGRLAAIYLDKPLMTDAFGCQGTVDAEGGVVLQDWNTFLQAGHRLVDYVQASGGNAAVMTAIGEGGALYPTSVFAATPRYDTGTFFSDGRDPVRKDVLELMLRLFERSGLRLVVGVELATPLPQLEAALEHPETAVGLEWTDAVGRQYVDRRPPRHGLAPYYNLLDSRTEQQVSAVVQEIRDRYAHHRSFAGLGLHLGPQTYLQLPSPAWGRDPKTLEKLRSDWSRGETPNSPPSGPAIHAWLDGEAAHWFSAWRQRQVSELFARLASETGGHPLVLLTADLLPPASGGAAGSGEAADSGLDWQDLATRPGIVPMRLLREQLLVEPARRIDDAKLWEDMSWDRLLSEAAHRATTADPGGAEGSSFSGAAGSLLFRPPTEQLLPVSASAVPWQRPGEPLRLFTQAVPGGEAYRMRMARMLDSLDPQIIAVGGWAPSSGQEAYGRSFLAAFAALPEAPFETVPSEDVAASAVRVRQYRDESGLYIYAVNTAPWRMRMQIATDATAGTEVHRLGDDPQSWTIGGRFTQVRQGTVPSGVSTTWAGELGPGELIALHVRGRARGVAAWSGVPLNADRVATELASQVEELSARVSILGRPRPYAALANGGFETGTAERIEGWLRAQHPPECIRFESDAAEGQRAIVLRNETRPGARTWLLSDPIAAPETGRIALSLRARSLSGAARIRIAFEGRVRDAALRRSVEVSVPPGGEWSQDPLWLMVPDLPASDVEELRVAIDLISAGEITIDEVRLFDFYLTERERSELQRQMFVAVERMRRGDFTAAARLLDSHWAKYLRWLRMPAAAAGGNPPSPGSSPARGVNPRPASSEEPPPGVARRLREWLPEPLRF